MSEEVSRQQFNSAGAILIGGAPRLKAVFTVQAGLIPGKPEPQYTRQWVYTSEDMEADEALPPMPEGHVIDLNGPLDQPHMSRFTAMQIEASRYYAALMNPARLNWATTHWVWM